MARFHGLDRFAFIFGFAFISGFVMVFNIRYYPGVVRAYITLNRRQERKTHFQCQKRHFSSPMPKPNRYLRQRMDHLIKWYDEFTGMDEVRLAQKRVLEDEEDFRASQERRRTVLNELTEVQQKLKDLYVELENTPRGEERYVLLVTQESKLLKEEKHVLERFARAEKEEREAFAALSSSVKLSHEKERAQSERTKYWSIIGSILGTVLGLLGSSINSHFKMRELKQLIKNSTNIQLIECVNSYIETNEKIIEKYKATVKADENEDFKKDLMKIEELLQSLHEKLTYLETSLRIIEKNTEINTMKLVSTDKGEDGSIIALPLEDSLNKNYHQIKILLVVVAVMTILVPVVTKYS